jgi:EAL and modified HD-GYP domain-containing signal transduction protein
MHRTKDATATAPAPTKTSKEAPVLVARQPIYGQAMNVIAYELLYKESTTTAASADARRTTVGMVADAALEIGLDRLAGALPVHINYPRELVVQPMPVSLQPERVVIEVVEDLPNDTRLIEGVMALRARGHRIALDDYSPRINGSALLDHVHMVKIDVSQESPEELARDLPALAARGVKLIAQEVSSVEQFERCCELGFEGFQGDFLQRPQTFRVRRVPTNRLATLRLIAVLQDPNCTIEAIEQLVAQDVSLSYRVLRCINSSFYNLPRRIDSVRQAIVILGLDTLRQLCTLVALQGFDDRPPSLFITAMTRARMCEQLARLAGTADPAPYFITGLFSMLDVLTGMRMTQVLEELPLAEPVQRALIAREGELGAALRCTRAYERASWEKVSFAGIAAPLIRAAYVDAVFWAEGAQALVAA